MTTLALALLLQVQPPDPSRTPPSLVNIERRSAPQAELEDNAAPQQKRSTAWVIAGGYGMAALGAGIGGVIADALSRQSSHLADVKDTHAGNRGMAIGALIGLVPGLVFGNEARLEENSLGRSVILVMAAGGTLALGFGWTSTHTRLTF